MTVRSVLSAIVIVAGPIAIFCVIGALPYADVSWLGGGITGTVLAMATPGIAAIAMLRFRWWQRAVAASLYLLLYAPACLVPGFLAACALTGCAP